MDERILRCIDDADAVPSIPDVVTHLLEVTADPDFKIKDVVRVLAADAGIASDVVRMANSSLYGGTNKTSTLDKAITRLGIKRIRELVVARGLMAGIAASKTPLIDASYFWRRSLGTAVVAAHFADAVKCIERDRAFLAGLFSDVGVVILARAVPDDYREVTAFYTPRSECDFRVHERRTLGLSHAEVGAMALERWSLPQELVLAVRHHHDFEFEDESVPGDAVRLALLVNGAGDVATCLCEASDPVHIKEVCTKAVKTVGLDISTLPPILRRVEPEIEDLANLLRLDIIPSKVYTLIAESVSEQLAPASS
ncbi:MAG: HDOD domain-containing protein [Planctomycetes bacterium]|nr:HDOD domain-containing protein [Planctomycetota bacterium]